MRSVTIHYILLIFAACLLAASAFTAKGQSFASNDQMTARHFEDRAKQYVELRERLENTLPKLSTEAEPEEIEAHKLSFQRIVREARGGAKQGDIFTAPAAELIRQIIRSHYTGKDLVALRELALGGETKGVPLRINFPYPEAKEQVEMPPTLLMKLPLLPKQLRYRFVGRNLLLVDRENALIIDYMTNAVP